MKQLHWIFGVWLWTFSFLGLGLGLIGQETAPKFSARNARLLVDSRANKEFKKLVAQQEELTRHTHVLRVASKIPDAAEGGVLAGDSIRVSRNIRGTQTAGVQSTDIFNPLVDDAVLRLLEAFPDKVLQVAKAEGDNPDTKEFLGKEEVEIGKVRVTAVLSQFSKVSILENRGITEGPLLRKCLRNVG